MIELDRHIEILLLTNDCVIIPGFGGFMAHYVESRKDERDFAFLPPKRTIGFNQKLTLNDSLLAQSYVEVYDISYPDALMRIEDEVRELRQHLDNEQHYEMNGIGTLTLSAEGHYEFEPCSSGILTPSLYGLGYFDLQTVAQLEAEQAELSAAEQAEAADKPRHASLRTEAEQADKATHINLWRNVAVACIAIIAFLLMPAQLANDNQQLVKSQVNTALLDYVMPQDQIFGQADLQQTMIQAAKEQQESNIEAKAKAEVKAEAESKAEAQAKAEAKAEAAKTKAEAESKTSASAAKAAETAAQTKAAQAKAQEPQAHGFTIVLAARVARQGANRYVEKLNKRGYNQARMMTEGSATKVVYGNYASQEEAAAELRKLRENKEFAEAWILRY